jgi:hypothetical protein
MKLAAERMTALDPETIVLVAPHGFRAADANTASLCKHNSVSLRTWYTWQDDELKIPGDAELAVQILEGTQPAELSDGQQLLDSSARGRANESISCSRWSRDAQRIPLT